MKRNLRLETEANDTPSGVTRGFRGGRGALAGGMVSVQYLRGARRGGMISVQYLRGARRGRGNLLAGRSKILGEGGNENLYPPLDTPATLMLTRGLQGGFICPPLRRGGLEEIFVWQS